MNCEKIWIFSRIPLPPLWGTLSPGEGIRIEITY